MIKDMSFAENGFLKFNEIGFSNLYELECNDIDSACDQINRFGQQLCYDLHPVKESSWQVLVSTLYVRALQNFQATILLARKGMPSQAWAMARVFLESSYLLLAALRDETAYFTYLNSDVATSRSSIENILKSDLHKDVRATYQALLDSLPIPTPGMRRSSLKSIAKAAGMSDHYYTAYNILSDAVHSSLRHLEQTTIKAVDGAPDALIHEPSTVRVGYALAIIADLMLAIIHEVADKMESNIKELIPDLQSQLSPIMNEHMTYQPKSARHSTTRQAT